MAVKIIREKISRKELQEIADQQFGDVVKAVVDIEQGIMAVGGDLHADEEVLLMEQAGSKREHTWGINLYVHEIRDKFIEFDSMVNIKPSFNNRSRSVENNEVRERIKTIVQKLITA